MEYHTAEKLIEWVTSSNIFIHGELGKLKEKLENMLETLAQTKSNTSASVIDSNQKKLILGIAEIYILFSSYQLSRGQSGKARSLLDKSLQVVSVLQSAPGEIGNVNMQLRQTLLSSLLNRKSPEHMLAILLRHSKEFQSKGVEKYSLVIYQFLISTIYLQLGNKSSFYNRVNTLRDALHRLLHMKTILANSLALEVVVCTKVTPFANSCLLKSIGATSLLFDLYNELNYQVVKEAGEDLGLKLANADIITQDLPETFQTAVLDFKLTIQMKLPKITQKKANDQKGNNYVVNVQPSEGSKIFLKDKLKKSKFSSKGLTGSHSHKPSISQTLGFTKAGIYFGGPAIDLKQISDRPESRAKGKVDGKGRSLTEASESTFKLSFLTKKSHRNKEKVSSDQFRVSNERSVNPRNLTFGQSQVMSSHRPSVTRITDIFDKNKDGGIVDGGRLNEASAKEGSLTKRLEWSHTSATQGFMSTRRFTYTKGAQIEGSKGSTQFSKTHRSNKGSIAGDLRIHSSYYTQLKKVTDNAKEVSCDKEFPEGVPRGENGEIVIGRKKRNSSRSLFGSGKLLTDTAVDMLSQRPSTKTHTRIQSAIGTIAATDFLDKAVIKNPKDKEVGISQDEKPNFKPERPLSARMSTIKSAYGLHRRSQTKCEDVLQDKKDALPSAGVSVVDPNIDRPGIVVSRASARASENQLKAVSKFVDKKSSDGAFGGYLDNFMTPRSTKKVVDLKVVRQSVLGIGTMLVAGQPVKRRQSVMVDSSCKETNKKISPFQVVKGGRIMHATNFMAAPDVFPPSTLKRLSSRMSYPIIESKHELGESQDEMMNFDGENKKSESGGQSISFKTHRSSKGQKKTKMQLKIQPGDIYNTESDLGDQGDYLRSPVAGTPHYTAEKSRFAKADKSISDHSYIHANDSKVQTSQKVVQDSHIKTKARKSNTDAHQGSLKSSSILQDAEITNRLSRKSSIIKDEAPQLRHDTTSKFKSRAGVRKGLLEQLDYDSEASSESEDKDDGNQESKSGDPGIRDFSAPQFRLLRLVKGAEALYRFDEKKRERTYRMVLFVLHFFSINFKGGRPRPEKNSSTIDLTEYQIIKKIIDPSIIDKKLRTNSEETRKRSLEAYYPKIFFGLKAKTLVQNSFGRKNKSLKKTYLKLIPARMTESYPLHLAFVETPKKCFLNIYMSSFLRSNSTINQGVSSWLTLIKYLKEHIAFVDIEKIQTMIVDYGRKPRYGANDEKNRLLMSMFLLLVSEKSLMVRTYLGGYTMKFLDLSLTAIKSRLEKSSAKYIESLQSRVNLCKITYDKSYEIYCSKIKDHNGALETGDMWKTDVQDLKKYSPRNESYVEFDSPGTFRNAQSLTFSRFDTPSFVPRFAELSLPRPRSTKRKNSIFINEMTYNTVEAIKNMIPLPQDHQDIEMPEYPTELHMPEDNPFKTSQFAARRNDLAIPPLKYIETTEHNAIDNISPSSRTLHSPVIKDRHSKIGKERANLISIDELINLLEDNRTKLKSIYNTRREKDLDLSSRRRLRKAMTAVTYPKIFRLNPILATIVLRDKTLGLGQSFFVLYISINLNDYSTLECTVDISNRQIGNDQQRGSFEIDQLEKACKINPGVLEQAMQILQRGGHIPSTIKLNILECLRKSIGKFLITKLEEKALQLPCLKKYH